MGVEERRKKLMAAGPNWGDRRPHHVPVTQHPCDCQCLEASTSTSDASLLTIHDMHNVAEPTPNYPTSTVSTKSWSLKHILDAGKRFRAIPRVSSSLAREIIKYEREGQPLIIEGLHHHPDWPRDAFHPNWLMTHGAKDISVRNVNDWSDKTIPLSEFIEKARASPKFTSPGEQERLYGKDAECPQEWNEWLHESGVIPSSLTPNHPEDLLSSGVETLMCYLGIGDTFTPCHKDLCASSGQNLMCYTENDGSSFWFMTRSSDAPEASKYFQKLEQELDHETHVITVEQLAKAPFEVFIGEQQLGDLVLVPPRSCHQVVNNGGLTIKTSWSRMTLKGLETAYYHELPIYRRVCRTETYRVKYTIYHTLRQKINDLANLRRRDIHSHLLLTGKKNDNVLASTKTLLKLFDAILVEEYSPDHGKMHCLSSRSPSPPASSDLNDAASDYIGSGDVQDHVTCDFCGADIFQSFFECLNCVPSDASGDPKVMHGDGFVLCAGCYVEGRSCKCTTMEPIQCRPFGQLLSIRNKAAELLFANTHTNAHTDLFSPMQTSTLSSGRGTFIAACLLEQARKGKRDSKVCTLPKGNTPSHQVPSSWALTCKKCHHAKCFTHLLMSQKLHAADALLNHFSDSLHETHHQGHLTSKGIFEEGREDFLLSQKNGNKPNLSQQRAHLALEYVTCQPINSRFMRLGWYDKNARILHMAPDQDEELPDDPSLSDALIPDSPITTSLPPSTLPQADSPGTLATARQTPLPNSTSHKRKRILLDYIEIPAHKVKRPSRSPSSTIDSRSLSAPQESTSVQSVSDEPQMLSVGALDTQQTCVTMQVDLTCSPTITTEDAISMKDSSAAPDTELFTTPTIISPAIPHSTITDATTPVQSSNPNLRRKGRFVKSPGRGPRSSRALDVPRADLGPATASTSASSTATCAPEIISGTSQRLQNMRHEAFSATASRPSSPAEDTARRVRRRDLVNSNTDAVPGLHFKKNSSKRGARAAKRLPPTNTSYQSSSSSSTYPQSTSSDGLAQALNHATWNNHYMHNAGYRPDHNIAQSVPNNPHLLPIADGQHDHVVKQLRDEVDHLKDEVKWLRQSQPPQIPQNPLHQLLQPGIATEIFLNGLAVMTQKVNAPGTSHSLPPQNPYWSQGGPTPHVEQQQFYHMPPHNRQDSGYYDPAPSTPWERWQPYEREGCYDVSYIGADHNAAFGPLPEDRVYYESPRIETCHDNDRGHPTIYEREIFAGSGQYGPRQRLSSGIIQQNNSFPRHRAKYAGPYNRQPVDNGWQRNGAGKPNIDDLHQTRSDGGPSPPAVTNTQKSQNAKQNRGHMRRHISQGSNPPSSISPRSTTQRPITPNDSLPLTPHSPVDIRANNMFSTDPSTPQPPMQPSSDSQASQAWLEVAQNVQLVSKTPVDIHLEPATNWDARDGRAPAHTPLATRSEQSMNWEDDYEQPEEAAVVAPDNLAKDCFAPSGSRSVTSLGYGDVTDNPWTL